MSLTSGFTTWTHVRCPHDYITNVQRRLDNRAYTGFGQCRLCGFLDSPLEHGENCSTAEATRGHTVLGGPTLADPGDATEPRGLTEAPFIPADLFTTAVVPGRSADLDVCVAPPMQHPKGMRHKQPLIVKPHTTDDEFPTFGVRRSFIVPWCGQQTVAYTQQSPRPF